MTQTFQTNITVMKDADGTKEIFTVHTENGKKVLTMDVREKLVDLIIEECVDYKYCPNCGAKMDGGAENG